MIFCIFIIIFINTAEKYLLNVKQFSLSSLYIDPLLSIVSAIMGTFVIIFVYDGFLKEVVETDISQKIKDGLISVLNERENLKYHGVIGVYDHFDSKFFEEYLEKAKSVKILQTYAQNLIGLRLAILTCLAAGGEIKVALLKKESQFVDIRARELDVTREIFVSQIEHNIATLRCFQKDMKYTGNLEIALYDSSPGVSLYATEHVAIMGNFLNGIDSASAPQLAIQNKTVLYKVFIEHFDNIWNNAEKIL